MNLKIVATAILSAVTATVATCILLVAATAAEPSPKRAQQLKENVTFLFQKSGTNDYTAIGTGFWVGVPHSGDTNRLAPYFVTAKHVLWNGTNVQLDGIFMRHNTAEGDSPYIPFTEESLRSRVLVHPDSSVDLVAIAARPSSTNLALRMMKLKDLTTREEYRSLGIEEGDDVFFVGLFTGFYGSKRNYPVFRFGRVAMVTDEKIPWQGTPSDLYLMEAQTFPGNSGSPVFFDIGPLRNGRFKLGSSTVKLAGVMTGYFGLTEKSEIFQAKVYSRHSQNVGISAVTPAHYLHELLSSEAAKRLYSGASGSPTGDKPVEH